MNVAPSAEPSAHARAILAYLGDRTAPTIGRELADPQHPLFAHADALADAADHADEAIRAAGLTALFAGVVEPLNDSFRPAGRALYAAIFTRVVWRVASRHPALADRLGRFAITSEADLSVRYHELRQRRSPWAGATPRTIAVLSRVTVGADILLTTVALQRLRQRFAKATLVVIGDAKLQGLLGGFPNIRVRGLAYGRRGPLSERLQSWLALSDVLAEESPDLVVQPDSRLTQLGILPVGDDPQATWLWENTLPDEAPAHSLARHLDRSLAAWLGLPAEPPLRPQLAFDPPTQALHRTLAAAFGPRPLCAVKLDHGGNPAKALPREAEVQLLKLLRDRGWRVVLDRGFGVAELQNSDALLQAANLGAVDLDDSGQGLGANAGALTPGALAQAEVIRFHGSIAGWAAACAACRLAISYDSVGHHLAAALAVPVVTAFTGHPDERFLEAWKPQGAGPVTVVAIPTATKQDPQTWRRLWEALPNSR